MQNIEMEGNFQKKGASIVSRSSEPFIQIDSISIDLISSDDKIDRGKCEHFSIRQFVSETRKKDWKMCWPFSLDGNQESDHQTSLLSPLEIPNFRWWRCPNCQQEISSKDFHPDSKLGTMEKKLIDISYSSNLNNDYCNPSSNIGVRGKRIEVEGSISGNVIGSEDGLKMEKHTFPSLTPKIISSVVLERCINNSVAAKPDSNGAREPCQSGHGSLKDGVIELSTTNLKVNGENQVENFKIGKKISTVDECRLLSQASEIVRVVEKGRNVVTIRDQSKSDPSTEVNRRKLSASEFVEISAGKDSQDSHVIKSCGSLRRKSRKLRLLTELLGENRSMKNKQAVVATNSPSNGTSDASAGPDTLYVPPSQVCHSRKRKLIQDEEWGPQEISSGNKNKFFEALKEDMKTTDSSMSCKFENSYARTGLKIIKSLSSKRRFNRDHMTSRKKCKKPKVPNPGFPLLLSRENVLEEIQEKHTSVYSYLDSFPLTYARTESQSSMFAKKNDMEYKEVLETPCFWDNDLLWSGSTGRKDVRTMRNKSVATPFQSRKDEFSDRGLHLSLSSYTAAPKLDTNCVPQGGTNLPSFWPQQGGPSGVSQFSRKEYESKRPLDSTSHFISSDPLVTRGMHCELNKKVNSCRMMPFPVETQQLTPQCEDSFCSHLQRMAIAGPSGCKKNTEVQERLANKKKQNDKRVENAYEKGAADDIPMEIVELMAKNQFERELHDDENKKRFSETTNSTRNAPMAYYGNSYSNRSSRLLPERESNKPKPHARNKSNGVISAKEAVEPNKQSSVDYLYHISGCHYNTNHLQQNHSSEGYGAVVQPQKKPFSGFNYSAAGSSKIGSSLRGKYGGNMEDVGSSYPRVHAFEGCGGHPTVSPQNEGRARLCSEMVLNQGPFGCTIPQKGSAKSTNADKVLNGHTLMDYGNFSAQNGLKIQDTNSMNVEKKNSAYSLQALSRTNAECPYSYHSTGVEIQKNAMNSLDLCSNETIPAMHLLSLMDAGMQSTPSFTPPGMSKFPKKSSFPLNLKPNEFSGFNVMSNKKIAAVRFPLSGMSEKSRDQIPAGSALDESASFNQAKRFVRTSNFDGQFGSKSHKKEKTKRSVSSTWNSSKKSQKCVATTTSDGMDTDNNGALAVHNVPKSSSDPANSALLTVGFQKNKRVSQCILEDHGSNSMLTTVKRPSDTGVCTINKNPSDFSLPEAGNIYTIGADDLKFGRKTSCTIQSGSIVLAGRKRKMNVKYNVDQKS